MSASRQPRRVVCATAGKCTNSYKCFIFNAIDIGRERANSVCEAREGTMMAMIQFATLATATILAVLAAVAFDWLLLRMTFHLMRPATAKRLAMRGEMVHGTMELARAYAGRR